MGVKKLMQQVRTMLKFEDPPNFMILHVAGNDIGDMKVGNLRNYIKRVLKWVAQMLPGTRLIWSQILPRINWRFSNNSVAMEKCRYRLNNATAAFIIRNGGYYIRYPDIRPDEICIATDGVHLTNLGNQIFLNTLQGAIEHFVTYPQSQTFPF